MYEVIAKLKRCSRLFLPSNFSEKKSGSVAVTQTKTKAATLSETSGKDGFANSRFEQCFPIQHGILNLPIRKDVVKNSLRSSLCVFTNLFSLS